MLTAPPDLGELSAGCDELDGVELLMLLLGPGGPLARRTALVSSFGAESVVLLHMAAVVDPALPVVFLETGKHFPETLAYRDRLVRDLGLRDVRAVRPDRLALLQNDRHGRLFAEDPDLCCHIRKTEPLEDALRGFAAWITGRKRFQGGLRADLPVIETEPSTGRLKLNPLASWSAERLEAYRAAHGLPPHPLMGEGYRSIGCAPCTRPVRPGESPRAGRWSGIDKVECGIHLVRQRNGQAETAMERRAETAAEGEPVEAWPLGPGAAGTRDEILRPALERLAAGPGGHAEVAAAGMAGRAVEAVVPDPGLRALLLADPSLAALLPSFRGTLGHDAGAGPCCMDRRAGRKDPSPVWLHAVRT
jgi:phosphoadenosine phosphosulfate reductase